MVTVAKEAVVHWEMNDQGRHRLTYGSQEGEWTGYDFPCHITAKGKHYIGLTQYWLGEFSDTEVERPLLILILT